MEFGVLHSQPHGLLEILPAFVQVLTSLTAISYSNYYTTFALIINSCQFGLTSIQK